ncbi:MAG: BatA domain-containing protein [Pirellulales bacterium]|nr:BatA domain-containing protein [Pirellulales bacterium]
MLPVFLSPLLLWGLALIAIPLLIHLINLLRQQRVQWAAMEFLLQSQKRNHRWVLLRQLLLLALRVAAVIALVLALAQPALRSHWAQLFGSTTVHHVVLLDDSFSMADHWADTTAFNRAKEVVRTLAGQAAGQGISQQLSLLRYSQAAAQPDLLAEIVSTDLPNRLDDVLRPLAPSELNVGPAEALAGLDKLLGTSAGESRVIYLVSDFRAAQWQDPQAIVPELRKLAAAGARIELISCVDQPHENLAILRLRALDGTRAAGVPLFMEVAIHNFGRETANNIAVALAEDESPRPALAIESLPPGKTEVRRFPVRFTTAGQHLVTAQLESDALDVDNRRYCLVDLPLTVPVLVIDGDPQQRDGQLLTLALSPGGPVSTGVTPRVEGPRFLTTNSLDEFRVIYVTNVPQLDEAALAALEKFVAAGGGLAFFAGELNDPVALARDWHRAGQGLLPVPPAAVAELIVDRVERATDLEVTDHPIFRVFAGERNSFLNSVLVSRYLAITPGWKPAADSTVRTLATLRNGAPLVVEQRFGAGRVVAFLTTAAPVWNNWARNPSFIVAMLELQAYLTPQPPADDTLRVGTPLDVVLDAADYAAQVRFTAPHQEQAAPQVVDAARNGAQLVARLATTPAAGVYAAEVARNTGETEVRRFALNVAPEEGDLALLDGTQLAGRLSGLTYNWRLADDFALASPEEAGLQLSDALLGLLILLLVGEQALAYAASYHARTPGGAR